MSILFTRPPWQNVAGLPADNARYVPDVSLAAALYTPYLMVQDGGVSEVAGTSASSPAFAGIVARLAQGAGGRIGNLNPLLYATGRAQYGPTGTVTAPSFVGPPAFHDITAGSNSVPGLTGYSAGIGYDAATGLGSVDAGALASALPADRKSVV